jgi:hypothetical protein
MRKVPLKYLLVLLGGMPLIAGAGFAPSTYSPFVWAAGLMVEGFCTIAFGAFLSRDRIPLPQPGAAKLSFESAPAQYEAVLKRYVTTFYAVGASLILVGLVTASTL